MKDWLKYGLIGIGLVAILIFISLFGVAVTCATGGTLSPTCNFFRKTAASPIYFLFPIIGAIIGLIVSKIKSKK